LRVIPGSPSSPLDAPTGCVFSLRCPLRHDACVEAPDLFGYDDHLDACWLPRDGRADLRRTTAAAEAPMQ
jgi:peptide/nickel transport system ATP-binding protein